MRCASWRPEHRSSLLLLPLHGLPILGSRTVAEIAPQLTHVLCGAFCGWLWRARSCESSFWSLSNGIQIRRSDQQMPSRVPAVLPSDSAVGTILQTLTIRATRTEACSPHSQHAN